MANKSTPRPCLKNCGREVVGRAKVCAHCNACACGRPKRLRHGTCHYCAPLSAINEESIEWVPNGRGIVVARR